MVQSLGGGGLFLFLFTIFINSGSFILSSIWLFVTPFSELSTGQTVANIFSFTLNVNLTSLRERIEMYHLGFLMNMGCESEYCLHILNLHLSGFGTLSQSLSILQSQLFHLYNGRNGNEN